MSAGSANKVIRFCICWYAVVGARKSFQCHWLKLGILIKLTMSISASSSIPPTPRHLHAYQPQPSHWWQVNCLASGFWLITRQMETNWVLVTGVQWNCWLLFNSCSILHVLTIQDMMNGLSLTTKKHCPWSLD